MEAVHLMASSLRVDRSTSTAVRFAARNGSDPVRTAFARLEWEVQVRHHASVDEGLFAMASRAGAHEPELKRALLTVLGAESERTREGLERRLDRALDMVSKAEDRRRSRLSSTLERPVTMLLGTGVVLPLVLVSLMPLLRVAQPSFGPATTALILLVVVPGMTLLGASRILDKNTLARPVLAAQIGEAVRAASFVIAPAFAAAAALWVFPSPLDVEPAYVAGAVAAVGSAVAGASLWRSAREDAKVRDEAESALPDLLHAIGSRMSAGRPAEQALLESVESTEGNALAERLRGVLFDVVVGRRDLGDAIARDEGLQACGRAGPALRLMASAARRDTEEAGRVVQHLAEFERLRLDAVASLEDKVRSVVETARTTAVVFAPLILGVTAGMYGLLSTIPSALTEGSRAVADPGAATAFAVVVSLYLVMEALIVEWFAARLLSRDPMASFGRAMCRDVPLALVLFFLAYWMAGRLF
jgi:Flp pilus assembly protein TadB